MPAIVHSHTQMWLNNDNPPLDAYSLCKQTVIPHHLKLSLHFRIYGKQY